ncbi:MAG: non-hydrolyzing UDP-N-acetylglucosamine 2-epimerase [Kiritimatiellia bacterium]
MLVVLGTRPEAIKLAPVVRELKRRRREFRCVLATTSQHREMLAPMLDFFGLAPDHDLAVMRPDQQLGELTGRVLAGLDRVLEAERPDWVVVQGDTTTAMAAGLAAFYRRVRLAHVEAGLRTNDKDSPFPEEINRRLVGVLADLHFAPTDRAVRNLRREGIAPAQIVRTGNTVTDALIWAAGKNRREPPRLPAGLPPPAKGRKLVLVTGHRRENFGGGLEQICRALKAAAAARPELDFVYPVHLNPHVKEPVYRLLSGHPQLFLVPPVEYPVLVALLKRAWLVVTDSGGIQEEAPTFGVPVLVTRDTTERPEGIRAGNARLVGTDGAAIRRWIERLAAAPAVHARMAQARNPYGDGHAAARIVDRLAAARA